MCAPAQLAVTKLCSVVTVQLAETWKVKCRTLCGLQWVRPQLPPDLRPRSSNPSAPKSPRSTFMQHYQVPSAEYSSYISHVISLGLAEDYIAQLRASCSSNSPLPLTAAIDQACRHLFGLVDDLQPVPASVHSLETLGQQDGAPVSDAAVGLAAAMPNTPEEEARILQLTQLIKPVMVRLSHITQSRLKNQLPSSGR